MKTPIDATGGAGGTAALLNGSQDFVMVDLWIITLSGGTIIRWHSKPDNSPLTFNNLGFAGGVYVAGPTIDRQRITTTVGLQVATMDMQIGATAADLINGVPILPFLRNNGFDGATVVLLKAYLPTWQSPITGCLINFSGRVTSLNNVTRSMATVTVSAWTVLLGVNMGPDVYQAGCLNRHYDPNTCTLTPTNVPGTVTSSGSEILVPTNLTNPDHYFDKGTVTFLTGPNAGIKRAIGTYVGGVMSFAYPLPEPATSGDTFNAVRGCLLSTIDCNAQSNLPHFRGQPYIPQAVNSVTGLPGA